jgi:glycine cleavage system H lipoate-binding protein
MSNALQVGESLEGPRSGQAAECLWMTCGAVDYRLCDRDFDCARCPLDRALRGESRRAAVGEAGPERPGDLFYHPRNAWARVEDGGLVRTGLDRPTALRLGRVYSVELPAPGTRVRRGDPCWRVIHGAGETDVVAPVSGLVREVNARLVLQPSTLVADPYGAGWALVVEPSELGVCLKSLMYGRKVR